MIRYASPVYRYLPVDARYQALGSSGSCSLGASSELLPPAVPDGPQARQGLASLNRGGHARCGTL